MAQLDGGANPADLDKAQGGTNDKEQNKDNGGDKADIQKQFDELKVQFENQKIISLFTTFGIEKNML